MLFCFLNVFFWPLLLLYSCQGRHQPQPGSAAVSGSCGCQEVERSSCSQKVEGSQFPWWAVLEQDAGPQIASMGC